MMGLALSACDDTTSNGPMPDLSVPAADMGRDMAMVVTGADMTVEPGIGQVTVADVVGTVYQDIGDGGELPVPAAHALSAVASFPAVSGTNQQADPDPFHGCGVNRYDFTVDAGARPVPDENAGDVLITGYETARVGVAGATMISPLPSMVTCTRSAVSGTYNCNYVATGNPSTDTVIVPPLPPPLGTGPQLGTIVDTTSITEKFTPAAGSTYSDPATKTLDAPLPVALHIVSVNGDTSKHNITDIKLSKTTDLVIAYSCDGSNTAGGGCPNGAAGITQIGAMLIQTALGPRNQSPPNRAQTGVAQCVDRMDTPAFKFTLTAAQQSLLLGTQTTGSARISIVHLTSSPTLSGQHPLIFTAGRGELGFINLP
jgi:hypothetical protein